jgi:hypothetical protein
LLGKQQQSMLKRRLGEIDNVEPAHYALLVRFILQSGWVKSLR